MTMWATRVATDAQLVDAGYRDGTVTVDGVNLVMLGSLEPSWTIQCDTTSPVVNIWEVQAPSQLMVKRRLVYSGRIPTGAYYNNTRRGGNDVAQLYDATGNCIRGLNAYHRPGGAGDIYINWQTPPPGHPANTVMGTLDEPGRGGAHSAPLINVHGTTITEAEYDAAAAGDESAIRHAVCLLVWGRLCMSPHDGGFRWPAFRADGNYRKAPPHKGGYTGTVAASRMGAHLTLPSRLTVADVPILGDTGPFPNFMRALAEALYMFGAYITDNTAWQRYTYVLDKRAFTKLNPLLGGWNTATPARLALAKLPTFLHVIDNNGDGMVAGGDATATRRTAHDEGGPMRYDNALESWQDPARPVAGPAFTWSTVDRVVIHYRGSGTAPVPADIAQMLRNSQQSYLNTRGYSLGYNAAVVSSAGHPLDGTSWEIRGDRYRSAANAGVNELSYSVLVVEVDNEHATDKARETIRSLVAAARSKAGRHLTITGHSFSGSTTVTLCPGTGLTADIKAGAFEQTIPEVPETKPPDESEEDDDMAYLFNRDGEYGLRGASGSRRVSGEEFDLGLVPPRTEAVMVKAGTNLHHWIGRELAAYDRATAK